MTSRRAKWLVLTLVLAVLLAAWLWKSSRPTPEAPGDADASVNHEIADADPDKAVPPEAPVEPAAEPRARELRVSSGQAVRLVSVARVELPVPPYGPAYEILRPDAEQAEAHVQYQLGKLLYECRYIPEEEAQLLSEIDVLYQTRRRHGWDIRDPEQEAESMRQSFKDCQGVPAEARGEYRDWMRRAADAGLVEAQLNLMFHLPRGEYCQYIEECSADQVQLMESLRKEAREQVSEALAAGSVEALRLVGSWALNDEMGLVDPVSAYAHLSAYDQIQQAAGQERELQRLLESVRARLRPVEIGQAEDAASALLSAPNCCVWIQ